MRKIGYVRVSSVDQNPARQCQQLNEIGMDIIFEEKLPGATQDRSELQKNVGIPSKRGHHFCYGSYSNHSKHKRSI